MNQSSSNVRSIFGRALEIGLPADRAAYLDAACGANADLRSEVESLLQAMDKAGDFMRRPAVSAPDLGTTVDEPPIAERPGSIIGPYKLLEQIGEGGMGLVFVAEQHEPVRRKVALKVIKPGLDTREVIARFEAERQAVALMDHPNIATVLDAGATDSGRPYFVMELVRGVPITQFCDENRLTPRERLELFVSVCQAVQHAHQKGVIHRDVKPSNVLVTLHDGTPVVKVIDFGVAKAIGQQLIEKTIYTRFAQMLGTPLYMSPEQAELSGLDVDTRTDIYALGVLLYELLTGTTPFDSERLRTAGFDEMRRIIREEEPARPSTRISTLGLAAATISDNRKSDPRRLSQLCRGELDWIVMKALEKDRNRRYESASAFAADVQRYLHDEPVQACPPSRWYRARKFARRHKGALATAGAVAAAVLLAVGSLVSAVYVLAATNAQVKGEQKQTNDALEREKQARKDLTGALGREQLALYYQRIALAERELTGNNPGRAQELLDDCPPHLRGWEWYYLKRRCQAEPITIPTRERQTGGVGFDLAFSPDNRYLAVPTDSKNIRVWDVSAGRTVATLRGHKGRVWGVAFSPDGRRLASASQDKTVMVWEWVTDPGGMEDRKPLFVLQGHIGPGGGVTFSPDGMTLASASLDDGVMLWDMMTGGLLRSFPAHRPRSRGGQFAVVAFSPDGTRLASGGGENTVKVWEVATGQEICTLHGHTGPVSCVAFSRDGRRLVSKGQDQSVKVWDLPAAREAFSVRGHSNGTWCAALSPDGRLLAVGGGHTDGAVRLYDAATGELVQTLQGHIERVISVAFSPDGRRLASAGLDKHVKLWDTATGQEVLTLRGHTDIALRVHFSADGRCLASASGDGTVKVWDATPLEEAPDPRILTLRGHAGVVYGVAFSPDGQLLASASGDNTVKVWEAATGIERLTLRGHTDKILGVTFLDRGRLASAGLDNTVRLWDARTGQTLLSLPRFQAAVRRVASSADGQYLATSDADQSVQVWDSRTGQLISKLPGPFGQVWRVTFSPDGKHLATASAFGLAQVWDVATGKEVQAFRGHASRVYSVAFSPDGHTLASGDSDWKVKLWDGATAKEVRTLSGHTDYVFDLAFSPDGRYLASASWAEVKVWDWANGRELRTLTGHAGTIWGVAFSPNGRRLAAASGYKGRGEIKVWDAPLWEDQEGGVR